MYVGSGSGLGGELGSERTSPTSIRNAADGAEQEKPLC
jgi:hypothetical protein